MTQAPHLSNTPEPDWADRMEQTVLDSALELAPRLGWNGRMVRQACAANDLSEGDQELLLPNGPRDLAALLWRRHDEQALAALGDPDGLKIRERIAKAVSTRLEVAAADAEAEKRLSGFLALPTNADLVLSLTWGTADALWRWAGDTATDWNHYSKRTILSGILIPAMTLRLFDGKDASDAFVAARIENVMTFEKWKAGVDFDAPIRKATELLSRLRYPART
ncbi:MAG: COQ9 family protein [Alphaproteobacteria bacterium]|nr:COQ9 family protein [Alphaproteobacteria bacterium]MBU2379854.1 COQ9 family protein [Alphaproteobacteria bacterium]